jgi:hypothetical protein
MWLPDRDDEMPFREMVRQSLRWSMAVLPAMLIVGMGYYVLLLLYMAIMYSIIGAQIFFSGPPTP